MNISDPFRAVIFDWRGTLVTTLGEREWAVIAVLALVAVLLGRPRDRSSRPSTSPAG